MNHLAGKIRENLEELSQEYAQRLGNIDGYQEYAPQFLQQIAKDDLKLIAACIESDDPAQFISFTQEKAAERLQERFAPLPLLKALRAIKDILSPLAVDVESIKYLWDMLAEAQDIVALQIAEQSYYHKREFLWRVIDTTPSFIFVRDRDGKFILANQSLAKAYGTTVRDIVGKTDADFNPNPEEVEHLLQDDLEVMNSLQEKNIPERLITTPTGDQRWMSIIKRPLVDEDGVSRRVLGIASDISDRKQLEQELQGVAERRKRQVETSTEIAQEIAVAANLDEIYQHVVTLTKERFGYYHAQIFHHDPEKNAMVIVKGYGEAGEKMLAAKHSLPYGTGVVGTAASTGEPVLAADVGEDPYWLPHPDLPRTKGELAVPIIWREEVLGVLDVQSDQTGALSEEDQIVLQGLAGQVASAIESSRLLEQTQATLAELEATQRLYLREEWERFLPELETPYFERTQEGLRTKAEGTPQDQGEEAELVVPLTLRGETIGVLGLEKPAGSQTWTKEERSLVESVSEQLSLALESARLLEETQSRAAREQLVGEATTRMRETLNVDSVLRTAANEIYEALNLEHVTVQLLEDNTNPQEEISE